jgi:hypothetical protein
MGALLATLTGSCGGGSHASSPHTVAAAVGSPPPNVVGARQISSYPAHSAPRMLLELWQAIEFSDVETARSLVAPSTLAQLPKGDFARMVGTIGDNIPGLRVLDGHETGPNTSVRVYLVFYARGGGVAASSPMTFRFRRENGEYRLTDLSYFLRRAHEIRAALSRASHQ